MFSTGNVWASPLRSTSQTPYVRSSLQMITFAYFSTEFADLNCSVERDFYHDICDTLKIWGWDIFSLDSPFHPSTFHIVELLRWLRIFCLPCRSAQLALKLLFWGKKKKFKEKRYRNSLHFPTFGRYRYKVVVAPCIWPLIFGPIQHRLFNDDYLNEMGLEWWVTWHQPLPLRRQFLRSWHPRHCKHQIPSNYLPLFFKKQVYLDWIHWKWSRNNIVKNLAQ